MANDEYDNRQMDKAITIEIRKGMAEAIIDGLAIAAEQYMKTSETLIRQYRRNNSAEDALNVYAVNLQLQHDEDIANLRGYLMQVAEIPEKV